MQGPSPTQRRCYRIPVHLSVRALMVLVLILGGGLGWVVHRARVQRDAVAAIERAGGSVSYFWNWDAPNTARGRAIPPWLRPLVNTLGPDYFAGVDDVRPSDQLDDALMAHVGRLHGLRTLQIFGGRSLTDTGLVHLKGLKRLEMLSIYYSSVRGPAWLISKD